MNWFRFRVLPLFRREDPGYGKKLYILVYVITVLLSIVYIVAGRRYAVSGMPQFATYGSQQVIQAKVQEILEQTTEEAIIGGEVQISTTTYFNAIITSGEFEGTIIRALQLDDPFSPYRLRPAKTGDNIFLQYAPDNISDTPWVMQEYRRTDALLVMVAFVVLLILVFGKLKGLHTLISLIFTCLSIFTVFIPSILSGKNIYISTVVTGIFIITMTILIVYGPNRKSLCSAIGCLSGFLASGIMSLIMDRVLDLTGLIDEDAVYLLYLNPEDPINLRAIVFAAVTIGALGAILDVAISIASSLHEVYQADPWLEKKDLMRSGMNIGRDMIGTMSNTLLLAYIGSSLSLVVLLIAYNDSLMVLFNKEMIVVEVMQSLVGIAGLLMVIPLTSFVCSYVFTKRGSE